MLEYGIMKPYSNISCFSTTRHGGCGEGTYATFNCTHYCGDKPEHVSANLEILAAALPVRPKVFVIPRQTHTTNVRLITNVPAPEELQDVDAVVKHSSELLSDAELRQKMGENGRNLVIERFAWRRMADILEEEFLTLLKEKSGK